MMDAAPVEALSEALRDAVRTRVPIEAPTTSHPDLSVEDAYAVQLANVAARRRSGGRIIGHKVGLTSSAMQQMLGVDEPDYGHLFDDMAVADDECVDVERFLQPRIEPEVGFVLRDELRGPGVTVADVLRATDFVCPAIEIIDSRIADWKIALVDTIADNASSAGVVLGGRRTSLDGLDLSTTGCVLRKNGRIVETGAAGAVLGNPATAVAWLANKVAAYDISLEPGHIVLPGACTRAVDVGPGDVIDVEFDSLGTVSVSFS